MAVKNQMQKHVHTHVKHIKLKALAGIGLLVAGQWPELQSVNVPSEQEDAKHFFNFSGAQWPYLSSINPSKADFVTHSKADSKVFQADWPCMHTGARNEHCQHLQIAIGGLS